MTAPTDDDRARARDAASKAMALDVFAQGLAAERERLTTNAKVWTVIERVDYEGAHLAGVYSTRERAEASAQTQMEGWGGAVPWSQLERSDTVSHWESCGIHLYVELVTVDGEADR